MGFIIRWLVALGLISATYNPTEWNYTTWLARHYRDQMSLAVLLGLLLAITYIVYLRATLRSIGPFGMGLVLAVLAALLWVLYDYGVLTLKDQTLNTWLGILALSLVLGIGLNWSHVRRKLSGQSDMDDVDE